MTINTNTENKIRIAFGPVSGVRAIPSREVSVINIEIPEEMHVDATNLLYGRDALITLSSVVGSSYGILDPLEQAEQAHLDEKPRSPSNPQSKPEDNIRAIHGRVSGVRALPSRSVSVISVEVPEEAHVDVTQLIYGQEVLVMPVQLGATTPYGIVAGRGNAIHTRNKPAKGIATEQKQQGNTGMSSMFRLPVPINVVRWVGARCTESAFQEFLNVHNEAQAIERVRAICHVESRKDLATDRLARKIFMEQIYQPFITPPGARL